MMPSPQAEPNAAGDALLSGIISLLSATKGTPNESYVRTGLIAALGLGDATPKADPTLYADAYRVIRQYAHRHSETRGVMDRLRAAMGAKP